MANEQTKSELNYHGIEVDEKSSAYFLQELKIEQLENSLLGEFNSEGKYVISEDILKILVNLFKKVKKQDSSRMELEANCGKYIFKFIVEIGSLTIDTKFATLKFVEKFCTFVGDECEDLITPVMYYKDDDDIYFMSKIKKIFNIISEDENEGKDKINEELAKIILEKKAKMKNAFERYLQSSKNKDKLYIKKMMLVLEESGDFGKFVLRRYKSLIQEFSKALDPKKNDYYRNLKKILDTIILREKNRTKDFDELVGKLRTKYTTLNSKIFEISVNPPKPVKEQVVKLGKGPGLTKFKSSKSESKKSKSEVKKIPPSPVYKPKTKTDSSLQQLSEDNVSIYMRQSLQKIYQTIKKNAVQKDIDKVSAVESENNELINMVENSAQKIKKYQEPSQEI